MHTTQTTTEFLLGVAHEVILLRAAKDHQGPEVYDAAGDPEGYITSLITALHHWCHRHDIPWDMVLCNTEDRFTQDLVGSKGDASYVSITRIDQLMCPKCGHEGSFLVEVTENLLMFSDGVELSGDEGEQWGRTSSCVCPTCSHLGMVFQFHDEQRKER